MMDIWHGYFAIERIAANLNEANWVALIDEVRQIVGIGNRLPYRLTERGNLDTFEWVADDPETEEDETVLYSNSYSFEAYFNENAIDFEKFKTRLVNLFDVEPNKVIYTTHTTTIRNRPSVFAAFKYNGKSRIQVGLFGCASDSELCTWKQSCFERAAHLVDNKDDWEPSE